MHIKDHSAAMKFFRTYDNVASKGKWKEFVDEMEFESMIQEPRATAQEPRIGLQGGQLVQPGVGRQGYKGLSTVEGIIKYVPTVKGQITKVGEYLKNLLEGRKVTKGIGRTRVKTDWAIEKEFTTNFEAFANKYFGGNFTDASKSIGESREKVRGVFQRLAKQETGISSYGKIATGSETISTLKIPLGTKTFAEVTTDLKHKPEILIEKIKKLVEQGKVDEKNFYNAKDLANILGVDYTRKFSIDQLTTLLKKNEALSQTIKSGEFAIKEYNLRDAYKKIIEWSRTKPVKGERLHSTNRVEIEKRLDHPLYKVRDKIRSQVKKASKDEDIYRRFAIDDVGHPVSIMITDKYPKLFKNSNVNRINSLVYQDPYINQDVMKMIGYETKFDSMFKELDKLVNKPVTKKTQIQILDIKKRMTDNYDKLIETISNPKKLEMVVKDAGKEISLSHLKNISTQINRIPRINVNVPKIGDTFKSSDLYADMSEVDSAYIVGHVNKINPTARYFKDLSLSEQALYEASMKEQASVILENYYKKAKFPKEQIGELKETLAYDFAQGGRIGLQDGKSAAADTSMISKIFSPHFPSGAPLDWKDRAKVLGTGAIGDVLLYQGQITKAIVKTGWKSLPFLWTPGGNAARALYHKLTSGKEPKIEDFAEPFENIGVDINSDVFKKEWNAVPEKGRKELLYKFAGKTMDTRSTSEKIKEKAASPETHVAYAFWKPTVEAMKRALNVSPGNKTLAKKWALRAIRMGIPMRVISAVNPIGWALTGATVYSAIQQEFEGKMRKTPLTESEQMDIQKRKEVVPKMLNTYEQASQIAKEQQISYEDALKQVNKPDIPGLDFKIDYSLPKNYAGGGSVNLTRTVAPDSGGIMSLKKKR